MIVAGVVERRVHSEVGVQVAHMVAYHVHHYPNSSLMARAYKINEILLAAEVVVQFLQISSPISMIPSVSVIDDWRNPDRVEAHSLNIVQVIDNTPVSASAVVAFMIGTLPRLSQPYCWPSLRAKRSVSSW